MLYKYSQRHVKEVFIFVQIRGREGTLISMIARKKLRERGHQINVDSTNDKHEWSKRRRTKRAREEHKNLVYTSSLDHRENTERDMFLFYV